MVAVSIYPEFAARFRFLITVLAASRGSSLSVTRLAKSRWLARAVIIGEIT